MATRIIAMFSFEQTTIQANIAIESEILTRDSWQLQVDSQRFQEKLALSELKER